MRLACIDIGSNTTRLLVADRHGAELREVDQDRAFTRIGRELRERHSISAAKLQEVVEVARRQAQRARELGAAEVRVVATAAIRGAENGAELAVAVGERCGLEVRVLSGSQEAALAFRGAAATLGRAAGDPLAVVDVGGGSTEIALGPPEREPGWCVSLPLGSGALADAHLAADPPTEPQLRAAREAARAVLDAVELPHRGPAEAVAVGGSATSLSRLVGPELDGPALARALALLVAAPSGEVARRHRLDPERVRLLPAGLLILEGVGERLGVPLRIGRGGVREGVLLEDLPATSARRA